MTPRAEARPFATALFDVVGSAEAGTAAEAALQSLNGAIADHADLRKALESPVVTPAQKRAVLDDVMGALGAFPVELRRLVHLLADHDRLSLLPVIATTFAARLRQARNIVEAEVVSAAPLGDERRSSLARALSHAAGGQVTVTERVDPSLIGGVVARVGSTVYDGSMTRQIERLRQRLHGDT